MTDYKMVLLVRTDLKMSKGKIAAQCGHAVTHLVLTAPENHSYWFREWYISGMKKVALRVTGHDEILKYKVRANELGLPSVKIIDAGYTQIPPGSLTVVGIGPAPEELIDLITKDLKLL